MELKNVVHSHGLKRDSGENFDDVYRSKAIILYLATGVNFYSRQEFLHIEMW